MTTEDNADLLCRAAADLREKAQFADPGPWSWSQNDMDGEDVISSPNGVQVAAEVDAADAGYIAAMDPTVGLALAAWLECEAANYNERDEFFGPKDVNPYALDVARAVLKEDQWNRSAST